MAEPLWQPRSDRAARLLGAGFFCGGVALLGYQGKVILDAVASAAENVTYFMAAIALGEMAVVLGAYWMVRGLAGYAAVRALQTNPRGLRGLMIASAVIVGGTLLGLKLWLGSLGYDA